MKKMGALDWTATILILIGALNWGLVGLFDYNLVTAIFGSGSALTKIIYLVIGLAGVYEVVMLLMPPKSEV